MKSNLISLNPSLSHYGFIYLYYLTNIPFTFLLFSLPIVPLSICFYQYQSPCLSLLVSLRSNSLSMFLPVSSLLVTFHSLPYFSTFQSTFPSLYSTLGLFLTVSCLYLSIKHLEPHFGDLILERTEERGTITH